MRAEVVHHQRDPVGIGKPPGDIVEEVSPVGLGPPDRDLGHAPRDQRLGRHKLRPATRRVFRSGMGPPHVQYAFRCPHSFACRAVRAASDRKYPSPDSLLDLRSNQRKRPISSGARWPGLGCHPIP